MNTLLWLHQSLLCSDSLISNFQMSLASMRRISAYAKLSMATVSGLQDGRAVDAEYILSSKTIARPNGERLKCFFLVAIESWIAEPSLGPELVGLEKVLRVMVERPVPNLSHSLGKSATRSYCLYPGLYSRQEGCAGQGWYPPSH